MIVECISLAKANQMTHIQVVRPVLQLMWNLSVLEWKAETTVQQALKSQQIIIISNAKLQAENDEYLSIFRGATGHRNGSALLGAGERAGWELF